MFRNQGIFQLKNHCTVVIDLHNWCNSLVGSIISPFLCKVISSCISYILSLSYKAELYLRKEFGKECS